MTGDIIQMKCDTCSDIIHEPFIECCECDTNVCTSCFASGREKDRHRNYHKYAVRRNDFPLFDNCNWSAKEECKLLSALSIYGYGNWEDISKHVHTRSKLECQEHYKKYFIENVQYAELKLLPETQQSLFPQPVIPYLYNLDVSINPPRNNPSDLYLTGYNAHRSEFEFSYDNQAERIFCIEDNYTDDEDECMDALKISLGNALNTRLKERERRYNIIKNHGLIMPRKVVSWLQRFEMCIGKNKCERLISFMQFMTGMQFDAFMEGLSLENELGQKLSKLNEYRKNGIKTLYSAHIFRQLKKENKQMVKEQKYATSAMMRKFVFDSPTKSQVIFGKNQITKIKRTAIPLELEDLPGYHKLSDMERELCSSLRLIPKNYLEFKDILIAENNKIGSLRLIDARKIIKIDVNKTRKMYDFLVSEGFLIKPAVTYPKAYST